MDYSNNSPETCGPVSSCPNNATIISSTHIQPEILMLFVLNFIIILFLVLRVYKAERLISDLIVNGLANGDGLESLKKDLETIKRHKRQVSIQENIYQKVLVQVELKTKELTSMLQSKERLLTSLSDHVTQLASKYHSSFPDFKEALTALRKEVTQLNVKLDSEVSSLHLRLSSFSSPSSSMNCLANQNQPETLFVHRTILPEKNVNDEFVHVPGLGLISTEELDQIDCSFINPHAEKKLKKIKFHNPLAWIKRKTRKELRMTEELIEEDRASFGFRSRM